MVTPRTSQATAAARLPNAASIAGAPLARSLSPQALEAILKSSEGGGPALPINVKLMLEGEEEVGSPHLEPFLAKHRGLLAADFVLSADGGQIAEDQPGLTLGLR